MGLVRSLASGIRNVIRSEDYWGAWARGDEDGFLDGASVAGTRVTRESVQAIAAVWACRNLIASTIASLPADAHIRQEGARLPFRPQPGWVNEPNAEQTRFQAIEQVLDSLLLDGTAYIYAPRSRLGVELWPVHPSVVRVYRRGGRVFYDVHDADGAGMLTLSGGVGGEMFHIPAHAAPGALKGMAPLEVARTMMGAGLAAQEFAARFYGQGMNMSGVIEAPGDVDIEEAREIKKDFSRASGGLHKSHLPAMLTGGASWKPMTMSAEQAQFIETRKLSKQDIATFFLVPPYKIGIVEPGAVSYASVEQQAIDFLQTTLLPWIERIEQAFTRYLLFDTPGVFFQFNVDGLLRGSVKDRAEALAIRRQWGTLSADEWRALEDEHPLPDGKGTDYIIPANFLAVGADPRPSAADQAMAALAAAITAREERA